MTTATLVPPASIPSTLHFTGRPLYLPLDQVQEHPQAGIVPEIAPERYAELLADVRERGIQQPVHAIMLAEDSYQVLDGRTRRRAALDAGHDTIPVFVIELLGETPVEYMIRQALLRRHLTDDQRACLALDLQKQMSQEASSDRAHRAGQASAQARSNLSGNLPDKSPDPVPVYPLDPRAPLDKQPRSGYAWRVEREIVVEELPACEYASGANPQEHPARYRTATSGKHYCATHLPGGVKRVELLVLLDEAAPVPSDEQPAGPGLQEDLEPYLFEELSEQLALPEGSTRWQLGNAAWQAPAIHPQIRRYIGLLEFAREGMSRPDAIKRLEAEIHPTPAKKAAAIDWADLVSNGVIAKRPAHALGTGDWILQVGSALTGYDPDSKTAWHLEVLMDGTELTTWPSEGVSPLYPQNEAKPKPEQLSDTAWAGPARDALRNGPRPEGELALMLACEHGGEYRDIKERVLPQLVESGFLVRKGSGGHLISLAGESKPAPQKGKRDTRREANVAVGLPPESRKVREAAQLEKQAPDLLPKVRTGELTLKEAKREASLRQEAEVLEEREQKAAEVRATEGALGRIVFSLEDLKSETAPFDLVLYNPIGPWNSIKPMDLKGHLHERSQLLLFGGHWGHAAHAIEWARSIGLPYPAFAHWHDTTNTGENGYPYDSYPHDMKMILWASGPGPWPGRKEYPRWGSDKRSSLLVGPQKNGTEFLPAHRLPQWLLWKMLERHANPGDRVLVLNCYHGDELLACEQYGCTYLGVELEKHRYAEFKKTWSRLTRCEIPPDPELPSEAEAGRAEQNQEILRAGHRILQMAQKTEEGRQAAFEACKRLIAGGCSSRSGLVRQLMKELGITRTTAEERLDNLEQRELLVRGEQPGNRHYRVSRLLGGQDV